MLFFIQSSAWSAGIQNAETKLHIDAFLSHFNSLSEEMKWIEISKAAKTRPEEDRAFFEKVQKTFMQEKIALPQFTHDKGILKYYWDKTEFSVESKGATNVAVNGHAIDIGPGKLTAATKILEDLLSKKSTNIMGIFLSPAYADEFSVLGAISATVGVIAGFALSSLPLLVGFGIALIAFILKTIVDYNVKENLNDVAVLCKELNTELDKLGQNHISEIRNILATNRRELYERCRAYPDSFQDDSFTHLTSHMPKQEPVNEDSLACTAKYKCLKDAEKKFFKSKGSVNNSGREVTKDITPSSTKKPVPSKSTSDQ